MSDWVRIRRGRVFIPRRSSQASKGDGTGPVSVCTNRRRGVSSRPSRTTTAPPVTSLCPPKYFVVAWITMSAPSASGRWRMGVIQVLSTAASAPAL